MADYNDKTKDELLEEARKRDLKGRSGMDKDELVAALEKDDDAGAVASSPEDEEPKEADGTRPETQVGHDSEASNPENEDVVENLSPEGQEALEEMGEEQAEQADLALDASGPLILEKPSERVMAGATSEEEAKEQEELLKDLPEDHVGNVLGDGSAPQGEARQGSGENGEVLQQDVVDFPPPPAEVAEERADLVNSKKSTLENANFVKTRAANEAFPDEGEYIAQPRFFNQRAQVYTDGLSGQADHNLELSYRVNDIGAGMYQVQDGPMAEEREAMERDRLGENDDE